MKKIFIFLLLIFGIASVFSQNVPVKGGKIIYSEVVTTQNQLNASTLYLNAEKWMTTTFLKGKNMIINEDKEKSVIVAKGTFPVKHRGLGKDVDSGNITYIVTIEARDGRYKYVFSDFYHVGTDQVLDFGACDKMVDTKRKVWGISMQGYFNYYLEQLDKQIKPLVNSLKESMKSEEFINEEW